MDNLEEYGFHTSENMTSAIIQEIIDISDNYINNIQLKCISNNDELFNEYMNDLLKSKKIKKFVDNKIDPYTYIKLFDTIKQEIKNENTYLDEMYFNILLMHSYNLIALKIVVYLK